VIVELRERNGLITSRNARVQAGRLGACDALRLIITGCEIEGAYIDKGYRGHRAPNSRRVFIKAR
jgi:hypothetical protein